MRLFLLPLLATLLAGCASANQAKLVGLLKSSVKALRAGGRYDDLPRESKAQALRKLLVLQGVEVDPSVDFSSLDPSRIAADISSKTTPVRKSALETSVATAVRSTRARNTPRQPLKERAYLIGSRDVLAVSVFTQDGGKSGSDPTLEIGVNNVGFISLPLIGKVKAGGRTTGQLELEITKKYQRFVKDPQVSVYIREYRAKRIFIVGQVVTNGEISLEHEDTTLFEIISRAGGFVVDSADQVNGADARNILVQRGGEKIRIDFYGEVTDTQTALNFLVQDADQIFVPKPLDRIRVLGGVKAAGEFVYKPGMTLMDAIALSGSFTEKSRRDQVRILREGGGRKNTTHVNATKIFSGRAEDEVLRPGDVVYVSEW